MNQATLAWAAFKNMLREAGRDPVWAITALCVGFAGVGLLHLLGLQQSAVANAVLSLFLLLVLLVLLFRLVTNPLIIHFGDMDDETHGSARFATDKDADRSSDRIAHWVIAHRLRKPSSRWTNDQSCTNFQNGLLK